MVVMRVVTMGVDDATDENISTSATRLHKIMTEINFPYVMRFEESHKIMRLLTVVILWRQTLALAATL